MYTIVHHYARQLMIIWCFATLYKHTVIRGNMLLCVMRRYRLIEVVQIVAFFETVSLAGYGKNWGANAFIAAVAACEAPVAREGRVGPADASSWRRRGVAPRCGCRLRPPARSCDPAPPARKNEWFLCTHAPGAPGRPTRAARRSAGRFRYALSCALVMQSQRRRCFAGPRLGRQPKPRRGFGR